MRGKVSAISDYGQRELAVGGGSFLSHLIFPKICAAMCKKMPELSLKMDLGGNMGPIKMIDKLEAGSLDIALAYSFEADRFSGFPLISESYYLAVREDLAVAEELIPYAVSKEKILSAVTRGYRFYFGGAGALR